MKKEITQTPASTSENVMRVIFRDAVTAKVTSIWNSDRELAGSLNIANTGVFCSRREFTEQGITNVVNGMPSIKKPQDVIDAMLSIYKTVTAPAPACTR